MQPKYCDIFWSFLKVGAFTVGGGYAMIPLMQRELVTKHGWMGEEEFMDQVALSQAMPGVFAVNMATMTGYRLRGKCGAAVAIVGNVLSASSWDCGLVLSPSLPLRCSLWPRVQR